MGVLLIRRLEADGCLGQLPDFLPAMNCSGFSFMVTRWLLWLHASQPCSREKEMWEGTAFPFPLHWSSQTSAYVSLARLWKLPATSSRHSAGMKRKVRKSPGMASVVTQQLSGAESGPALLILNVTILSCSPLPI